MCTFVGTFSKPPNIEQRMLLVTVTHLSVSSVEDSTQQIMKSRDA